MMGDPSLSAEMASYLVVNGYESLAEWADDNDFVYEGENEEWYRSSEFGGPWAKPVDILVELATVMSGREH